MKIKKSYLLIIIFSLIISCSNPSTNPDNNNQNTLSSVKAVTSGVHSIQYGSKTSEIDVVDKTNLQNLWFNLVNRQTVYKANDYKVIAGNFDNNANYYDSADETSIRTEFIECGVYEYNNKKYLAGIYWDKKNTMPSAYRLIIIDETGTEQAWYGGGSDESVIPDANTQWTKYNFVFGYLQNY